MVLYRIFPCVEVPRWAVVPTGITTPAVPPRTRSPEVATSVPASTPPSQLTENIIDPEALTTLNLPSPSLLKPAQPIIHSHEQYFK